MKPPKNKTTAKDYDLIVVDLKYKYVNKPNRKIDWEIINWHHNCDLSFYGAIYMAHQKYDCGLFSLDKDRNILHPYSGKTDCIFGASNMWANKATFIQIREREKPKLNVKVEYSSLPFTSFSLDKSRDQARRLGDKISQFSDKWKSSLMPEFRIKDSHMIGVYASMPIGYALVRRGKIKEGDYRWSEATGGNAFGFWEKCGGYPEWEPQIGDKIEYTGYSVVGKAGKTVYSERYPQTIVIRKK